MEPLRINQHNRVEKFLQPCRRLVYCILGMVLLPSPLVPQGMRAVVIAISLTAQELPFGAFAASLMVYFGLQFFWSP
jgi:hypothetical protein